VAYLSAQSNGLSFQRRKDLTGATYDFYSTDEDVFTVKQQRRNKPLNAEGPSFTLLSLG
jgi:hypothetical protein